MAASEKSRVSEMLHEVVSNALGINNGADGARCMYQVRMIISLSWRGVFSVFVPTYWCCTRQSLVTMAAREIEPKWHSIPRE